MSTFVIFFIVLTLGYILYYAAMITIDLNAKSKSESSSEETISAEGMADDGYDNTPRKVVESATRGGFSIEKSEVSHQEEGNDIREADETEAAVAEAEDEQQDEAKEPSDTEQAPESSADDGGAQEEAGEHGNSDDENVPTKEAPEEIPSDGEDVGGEETDSDASVSDDEDSFDENKFFNKELFTPQYDVKTIVGADVSDATIAHAAEINAALNAIETKSLSMDAHALSRIMRKGEGNKLGVELTNEIQRY